MYVGPPLNCKWSWSKFGFLKHEYEPTDQYCPEGLRRILKCKNCGCVDMRWATEEEKRAFIGNLEPTDKQRLDWLEQQAPGVRDQIDQEIMKERKQNEPTQKSKTQS